MNFKANIIKFDKGILYQPIYISTELNDKIHRNYKLSGQWNNIGVIRVAFGKDVELTVDSTFYMGCRDLNDYPRFATKTFKSNEQRDEYYDGLVKLVQESIKYLIEFNG